MLEQPQAVAATLLSLTIVAAILYLAKTVLIPLALALLLSFLLGPLVSRLDRLGLGRLASIVLCIGFVSLIFLGLSWVITYEVNTIAEDFPGYEKNIALKIRNLRAFVEGGPIAAFRRLEAYSGKAERTLASHQPESPERGEDEPVQVRVVSADEPVDMLDIAKASSSVLSPIFDALGTAALSLILVIFILFQREDLRNRMVSFLSRRSLATPTKALDDAANRISRYLLMQLIINGSVGIAVGIGLYLLGLPYAPLWGLCAAVFRYVPYIGPWVAAMLPILVAAISSTGWTLAMYVIGLFLVLEIFSNNVLEPWLYGRGVGVSMIALLVSAAFWAWIWGPLGLILSTPLTVCVAVLGKYVPSLEFLDRLLSDAPPMKPDSIYLQRLLARDEHEASAVVRSYHAEHASPAVSENVLLPALARIRAERVAGTVTAEDEQFVLRATSLRLDELVPPVSAGGEKDELLSVNSTLTGDSELKITRPLVLGIPAHHESELLSLRMLQATLTSDSVCFKLINTRVVPSEVIRQAKQQCPAVTVIAVVPPGGLLQARYLCRGLRKACPDMGIIVGCWGYKGDWDGVILRLRRAGANYITTTLAGAQSHVDSWLAAESRQRSLLVAAEKADSAKQEVIHTTTGAPVS